MGCSETLCMRPSQKELDFSFSAKREEMDNLKFFQSPNNSDLTYSNSPKSINYSYESPIGLQKYNYRKHRQQSSEFSIFATIKKCEMIPEIRPVKSEHVLTN